VLATNTGPPLGCFEIHEFVVPKEQGGGRIFVVDVSAANTAHQSGLDHRYYQRIGTLTRPMEDFQIRDVMNRRTAPIIRVRLFRHSILRHSDVHQIWIEPHLSNVGALTLERWMFEMDLPLSAYAAAGKLMAVEMTSHVTLVNVDINRHPWMRVRYSASSQHLALAGANQIHPGQEVALGPSIGLPKMSLQIDQSVWFELSERNVPIRWRLFMPDALRLEGEMPFEEWCPF
jgi:hypothetical protein